MVENNPIIDFVSNISSPLMSIIIFLIVMIVFGLICFGLFKMSGE
jgi:hypothetical protein